MLRIGILAAVFVAATQSMADDATARAPSSEPARDSARETTLSHKAETPPVLDLKAAHRALRVTLGALTAEEKASTAEMADSRPNQIGIHRPLPSGFTGDLAPKLGWVSDPRGPIGCGDGSRLRRRGVGAHRRACDAAGGGLRAGIRWRWNSRWTGLHPRTLRTSRGQLGVAPKRRGRASHCADHRAFRGRPHRGVVHRDQGRPSLRPPDTEECTSVLRTRGSALRDGPRGARYRRRCCSPRLRKRRRYRFMYGNPAQCRGHA